jgi:hypothetical protein
MDRHRWRTIGVVTGIYTFMAMIKFVGMSLQHFGWCLWFTFFTLFEPEQAIEHYQKSPGDWFQWLHYGPNMTVVGTGSTLNNVVLMLMGIASFGFGMRIFARRDLPAPL